MVIEVRNQNGPLSVVLAGLKTPNGLIRGSRSTGFPKNQLLRAAQVFNVAAENNGHGIRSADIGRDLLGRFATDEDCFDFLVLGPNLGRGESSIDEVDGFFDPGHCKR